MKEKESLHISVLEMEAVLLALNAFHHGRVSNLDKKQCYSGSMHKEAGRHGFLSDGRSSLRCSHLGRAVLSLSCRKVHLGEEEYPAQSVNCLDEVFPT